MTIDQLFDAAGNGTVAAGVTHVGASLLSAAFSKQHAISDTITSRTSILGSAAIGGLAGFLTYDPTVDPLMATVGAGVVGAAVGAAVWPAVRAMLSTDRIQDRFKERMYQGALIAGTGSTLVYWLANYF